jgi:hypothetical protein
MYKSCSEKYEKPKHFTKDEIIKFQSFLKHFAINHISNLPKDIQIDMLYRNPDTIQYIDIIKYSELYDLYVLMYS